MSGNILISGGTGLIGKYLVKKLLEKGNNVFLLTRRINDKRDTENIKYIKWDISKSLDIVQFVEKCNTIINLAGEPIASKRWTKKQKEKLFNSRVITSRSLIESINLAKTKPNLFINASAIGFYGFDKIGIADENSPRGEGFLAELCEAWENENNKIRNLNIRQVGIRIGIVLAKDGGALPKLVLPYKFFIGGVIGPGDQWVPFIHIEDLVNIFIYAIENPKIEGYLNGVSPNAIQMRELCEVISKILKKPNFFYVPEFVLKTILGESAVIITGGKNVIPKKLVDLGFRFKFADIESALKDIYKNDSNSKFT